MTTPGVQVNRDWQAVPLAVQCVISASGYIEAAVREWLRKASKDGKVLVRYAPEYLKNRPNNIRRSYVRAWLENDDSVPEHDKSRAYECEWESPIEYLKHSVSAMDDPVIKNCTEWDLVSLEGALKRDTTINAQRHQPSREVGDPTNRTGLGRGQTFSKWPSR
jgi:hypothetical protein